MSVSAYPLRTPPEKLAALEAIRLAHPGTSGKTQCLRILAALAKFSITTYEITRYLDCYDARARVMQLRNDGAVIVTHWRTIVTDTGDKHRVGLYAMGNQQ
jgi:hypothetical protein